MPACRIFHRFARPRRSFSLENARPALMERLAVSFDEKLTDEKSQYFRYTYRYVFLRYVTFYVTNLPKKEIYRFTDERLLIIIIVVDTPGFSQSECIKYLCD